MATKRRGEHPAEPPQQKRGHALRQEGLELGVAGLFDRAAITASRIASGRP